MKKFQSYKLKPLLLKSQQSYHLRKVFVPTLLQNGFECVIRCRLLQTTIPYMNCISEISLHTTASSVSF